VSKDAFSDKNADFSFENSSSPTVVAKALRGGLWEKLADFDNHLENIKEDWLTNKAVV
jgi:hypothetical protein